MVQSRQEWHDIVRQNQDVGADGFELNFGCSHGMCERGMGSAVGQEPKVLQMIVEWVMEVATKPVIVKLTPNISDITESAMAARRVGADAISLINTIQSIVGVDIDQFASYPIVDGKGTNGGHCGPAMKPIALNMVKASSTPTCTCSFPASVVSRIGAMRCNTSCWVPAACRHARRRCILALASSVK